MSLDLCLPAELRGPRTTIAKLAEGYSGAGVYRVDALGHAYVLKVSAAQHTLADWRRTLVILRAASDAGLAPHVVHADESRRAVVSEFVTDDSFASLYRDASTHDAALVLMGESLRRLHDLPMPADATPSRPLQVLGTIRSALPADLTLPPFVSAALERALAEPPPPSDRALVLSHNDVNPTNFMLHGGRILFLDWDAAAPNDPLYDLATVSLFLRMDEETCMRLVAAHDGAPRSPLPPAFRYYRRLTGVMLGVGFLFFAKQLGHPGAAEPQTLDAVLPLADFFRQVQAGTLGFATAEGRWAFGLGLLREGHALE